MTYVIGFVLTLSLVVVVHELGHYLVAIRNGIGVEEFSLGFGKAIFSMKDKRGTVWKVSLIPFGGYVKMMGEAPDSSTSNNDSSFQNKSNFTKIRVLVAGPFANYALSIVAFAISFWLVGDYKPGTISKVFDGPAKELGLLAGDEIVAINSNQIENIEQFKSLVQSSNGDFVNIEYKRGGESRSVKLQPAKNAEGEYKIGVDIFVTKKAVGFFNVIKEAFWQTVIINVESAKAIKDIIIGKRSLKELSGPIKIAQYSGLALTQGFVAFVAFLGFLSASLGFMNLLPIPLLDGGQILINAAEIAFRRKFSPNFYKLAERFSMAVLALLTFFVILNDSLSFFR